MTVAIAICVAVLLMFLGIPIGAAFGLAGFAGLVITRGFDPALSMMGSAVYQWMSQEMLLPLPLFVLMGMFVFHSGVADSLFDAANKWLSRLPGGLAVATTLACTGFAACTGDSMASAAAMGKISYPSMQARGYSIRLSTSVIAAGGTLGILIPPSNVFIGYGFLTQTSVRDLFMAGIIPGLILSFLMNLLIVVRCKRNPTLGPPGASYPWRDRLISLKGVWGVLALFLLIIVGLYLGIFTPTEAGAIGSAGAFLVMLIQRRVTPRRVWEALLSSANITCFLFTLIIGSLIFNTFMNTSGAQTALDQWIHGLEVNRFVILAFILGFYWIAGFFLDMIAVTFLTTPIFFPVVVSLGFDPVWYGVVSCVLAEIALISPPLALNLYVVQGVTKAPLKEIFRGIWPFIVLFTIFLIILVAFPQLSLWLPNSM
jgi:C4-dicarboxylate transporter, DctM subunit